MNSYHYHRQAKIDKAIDKTGGVYPGGDSDEYLHSGLHGSGYVASRWTRFTTCEFVCTRSEFEARKAVRQNKPDWREAPDWAHYLAQDSSGHWYWFSSEPHIGLANGWILIVGKHGFSQSGTVIGDWRRTLELHPNHIVESDDKVALFAQASQRALAEMESIGLLVPCELGACDCIEQDWGLDPDVAPAFDFEALANQFKNADDINAVWSLRDKLLQKRQSSPELSFHLSNAFNELQASARLLPENDPRRSALAGIAGAVNAVREVA